MPFLERAKTVELLTVGEDRKQDEIAGATMIAHLARHGITAREERTAQGNISIENVILSYAADSGADFMVMGGYGHSRLREFVLGGVTRGILGSMTLPVLMSH
jgi:nucleotide-binding universal stress UspA family protein